MTCGVFGFILIITMAYPKKEKRNKDLIKMVHRGESYEEVGNHFNIDRKTAWDLHKQWCPVYYDKCPLEN